MSTIIEEIKKQITANDAKIKSGSPTTSVNTHDGHLVKMADIVPKEVSWLWFPYIPLGKITLLRGDPGQGKTTVALKLAAIVSNAWAFPNSKDNITSGPGNVLYITAEDSLEDTIAPRLIKAEANMDRVFSYREGTDIQLTFTSSLFEKLIKDSKATLVIVDPIQAYLGSNVDGHRANEIRPVMRHIGALAEKYNCSIILIEHMSKNTGVKGLYRGLGSIDATAAARSIILVGSNPTNENEKGLVLIKSNLAKAGDIIGFYISETNGVVWEEKTRLTADILQGNGNPRRSVNLTGIKPDNALEEAKEFLLEVLASGKQTSKDVQITAKQFGIAERTLQRAKKELNIDSSEREGFGKDTLVYWKLPKIHKLVQ